MLELWALFDFLMPGFLGTHAAFNARYGKALAASKGSKTGSPAAQAGLLAMEGLHKQARPHSMGTCLHRYLILPEAQMAPRWLRLGLFRFHRRKVTQIRFDSSCLRCHLC